LFAWALWSFLLALMGVVPLAFSLALLSDWADDTDLARKLRMTPAAMAGAVILGFLLLLAADVLHSPAITFVLIPTLAAGVVLFLLCATHFWVALTRFTAMGVWAHENAGTALDSGRRMSAKIVRRIAEGQAKAPAQPARAPKAAHKPAKPQGAFLASGDGVTYELAPPSAEAPAGGSGNGSSGGPGAQANQ
jgi:hypothetical protein